MENDLLSQENVVESCIEKKHKQYLVTKITILTTRSSSVGDAWGKVRVVNEWKLASPVVARHLASSP